MNKPDRRARYRMHCVFCKNEIPRGAHFEHHGGYPAHHRCLAKHLAAERKEES